jgi:hypothetical protein
MFSFLACGHDSLSCAPWKCPAGSCLKAFVWAAIGFVLVSPLQSPFTIPSKNPLATPLCYVILFYFLCITDHYVKLSQAIIWLWINCPILPHPHPNPSCMRAGISVWCSVVSKVCRTVSSTELVLIKYFLSEWVKDMSINVYN